MLSEVLLVQLTEVKVILFLHEGVCIVMAETSTEGGTVTVIGNM